MLRLREVAGTALGHHGRVKSAAWKNALLPIANGLPMGNGPLAQCHVELECKKGEDT